MWSDYFLYLLKTITFVVAVAFIIGVVVRASRGASEEGKGKLVVTKLNEALEGIKLRMQHEILPKKALKKEVKAVKEQHKQAEKEPSDRPVAYCLKFKGDLHASQVEALRQEVTAILTTAKSGDEVVVALESPGGAVSAYGLAASQLLRLKDAGLKVTACVDQVAASGDRKSTRLNSSH